VRIVTTGIETALKALAEKQTQATMPPQVITSVALVTKQSK
jgi:ribose transport system substrate-binding protein